MLQKGSVYFIWHINVLLRVYVLNIRPTSHDIKRLHLNCDPACEFQTKVSKCNYEI